MRFKISSAYAEEYAYKSTKKILPKPEGFFLLVSFTHTLHNKADDEY